MKRTTIIGGVFAGVLFGLAPGAGAATYCVNTAGADCAPGTFTLEQAHDAAEMSNVADVIRLGAGTYADPGSFTAGDGAAGLTIVGAGPSTIFTAAPGNALGSTITIGAGVELQNALVRQRVGDNNSGIIAEAPSSISGVAVEGDGTSSLTAGIGLNTTDPLETVLIDRVQIRGVNSGVTDQMADTRTDVTNSIIEATRPVDLDEGANSVTSSILLGKFSGVYAGTGGSVLVDSVLIKLDPTAPFGRGLDAAGGTIEATGVTIDTTDIEDAAGAAAGGAAGSLLLDSSVIRTKGGTLIQEGNGEVTVLNSSFDSSKTDGTITSGAGNIPAVADSVFTAPASFDYTPLAGTPLVDAGSAVATSLTDAAGRPRVVGARMDIGAFELQPPKALPQQPFVPKDLVGQKLGIGTKRARLTKKGTIKLKLTCPSGEASCKGSVAGGSAKKLRLKPKAKKKTLKLFGAKKFGAFTPAKAKTVEVKVAKAARKVIKKRGKLAVKLTVKATDAAGNTSTATKTITVLPYKK